MLADADLDTIAQLISGHRASLLLALMGDRTLTAGELADRAGISAPLASAHLARLLDGGLISVEQQGRHRHYRLSDPHVAEVIEAILTLAPHRRASSLREVNRGRAIREARTCYDHLAGALGVAVTDALTHQRILQPAEGSYELTRAGESRLSELGLDLEAVRGRRRAFARPCLDWTERRPHLAGALGAGLADRLFELGWVERRPHTRALRVTSTGREQLRDQLGVNLAVSES
ncbi:MAG TPA: helix-turn-helix domain-containing protein [Solirubrobacteraceae bacterium]|nr:helix-turn-helix domain-containing protein [Solirubrobacteraceae bacterium]